MTVKTIVVKVQGAANLPSVSASPVAGIDAIQAGSLATLTTDVAAAQVIGAGDASAEIDAIDADVVALTAALAAVETGVTGNVVITVDNGSVSRNQLRKALDEAYNYLDRSGFVT